MRSAGSEPPAAPPHKPDLPDRHTLHRVEFGPLFNFFFGWHTGFLLFSLGSGYLGDMTMEHFDVMHTINTEGLCPLLRDGRDTRITLLAKQGGPIGAYIIASAEMKRL